MLQINVGKPVQGENFFDRQREKRHLWDLLHNHHVLLLSPRRVGKTSLMYKLASEASAHQVRVVYQSCASAASEAQFVKELYEGVANQTGGEQVLAQLRRGSVKRVFRNVKSVSGLEFRDLPDDAWQELGTELAAALRQLDGHWYLMLDELPLLVIRLLEGDDGRKRVRAFLEWLRTLRQGEPGRPDHLHWLLAGSIGLDTLTRRLELGNTINDMTLFHLGPFPEATAHEFLSALGASYDLAMSDAVRERICAKAVWLIPFYLQLFFSQLRDRCHEQGTSPVAEDVDAVFETLLAPANRAYFDYWSQRLTEELGNPDAERAHDLLSSCARDPGGASRDTLDGALSQQISDSRQREKSRRYLLDVLTSDGYLIEVDGRHRFRSELLREWWTRTFD